MRSLDKLTLRFNTLQGRLCFNLGDLPGSLFSETVMDLLSHLIQYSDEHRTEAQSLNKEMAAFREELRGSLDEIWQRASRFEDQDESEDLTNPWLYRIQEEKRRRDFVISKIAKPEVKDYKWRFPS